MTFRQLVARGLIHYWRTNAAVVAGVATGVAVLAGALLVGDSVRGSLRDLVLERLGRTDYVVTSAGFFREQLADELPADTAALTGAAPLIVLPGIVSEQTDGRRAGRVRVYGVDERFWRFHGRQARGPASGDVLLSRALAEELGADAGGTVLIRVERPSAIPLESLHGRKDDLAGALRFTVRAVIGASDLGEFSLEAQQADVRAVFVPLRDLQEELELTARVNAILVSVRSGTGGRAGSALESAVRARATLDDIGLTLTTLELRRSLVVGSAAGLLTDIQARAAAMAASDEGLQTLPIFTYLANTLRRGDREIPYSLVTAIDLESIAAVLTPRTSDNPPIVLTDWAARDLAARMGDGVTLEYYLWEEPGRLVTRTATFQVAGVVPLDAGDRDLAPVYPGITDSPTVVDWDPPFPIDLRRIRPADDAYWKQYRTTPKAFVPLEVGQRLWRSRYGALTSIRVMPPAGDSLDGARRTYETRLRASLDPLAAGLGVRDVRGEGLAASRGATDFGAYFLYFSVFLVVSALLLAALFFKLGIEQRGREVGLLRAVGFGPAEVRRVFLCEGLLLAVAGSIAGVAGAVAYAALLMVGLRTWWVDAVGTNALTLHVSPLSLVIGAVAGVVAAAVCIWWTLRSLARISERSLLTGQIEEEPIRRADADRQPAVAITETTGRRPSGLRSRWPAALGFVAVLLLVASVAGMVEPAGAFFGAGALLLTSALTFFAGALRRPARRPIGGRGWQPVSHLGLRNTTYRPGRSVLSMAVIASATFILIAVDAFRRDTSAPPGEIRSGVGGYALIVETLLPIVHDPNSAEARDALNLPDLGSTRIEPFRLLPGDDASCLNLYEPRNPRILGVRDSFVDEGRFVFHSSLARTDAERANPWLLLERTEPDGAVPVIADANSMTYVLHRRLGDDVVIERGDRTIRLRIVAALRDSVFQSELLMGDRRFLELFPNEEGYRFLLVDTAPERAADVAEQVESALVDLGADATATAERLAEFHRVENTYLSTFQTLGGLGLLLGTIGLATVLLRNALERRRELALLGAVGFRERHFVLMAAAENALLLAGGLATGAVCAAVAIAPAVAERGGRLPLTSAGALLLFAVFLTGLLSSLLATRAATRAPLLSALRSE